MTHIIIRLIVQLTLTTFLSSILIFAFVRLIPGDPAAVILGPDATPERVELLRSEMGLDRPLPVQYVIWAGNALQGDLGRSSSGLQVMAVVRPALPATLALAAAAYVIGNTVGLAIGVLAAVNRGRLVDVTLGSFASVFIAVPSFVVGLLYLLAFSVWWPVLPAGGYVPLTEDPIAWFKHLILPAAALAGVAGAIMVRFSRQALVDTLSSDFIRTARAKGLPERTVIWRHALKPSLIPIITILGLQLGGMLGGAVVVEQVFTWPGMGRALVTAVGNRDYALVQGITLILVMTFVFFNLLADLVYAVADPRIRV